MVIPYDEAYPVHLGHLADVGDSALGSIVAGALGKNFSKKYLLSIIYTGRTVAAIIFIILPITPTSVLLFSVVMWTLWLVTVPLTSGIIGYIYGLQYMGTLYGIVFLSHQIGSFVGVWLGGSYGYGLSGFLTCYILALPFFGYTIAGDLFFCLLFKYSFKTVEKKYLIHSN